MTWSQAGALKSTEVANLKPVLERLWQDQSGYMDIDEPLGLSLGPNNIIAPVYCSAFDRFFDMCRHKLKMEVQSSEQIGGSADRRIG